MNLSIWSSEMKKSSRASALAVAALGAVGVANVASAATMDQNQNDRLEVSSSIVDQLQGMVREGAQIPGAMSPGPGPAPDHIRRETD